MKKSADVKRGITFLVILHLVYNLISVFARQPKRSPVPTRLECTARNRVAMESIHTCTRPVRHVKWQGSSIHTAHVICEDLDKWTCFPVPAWVGGGSAVRERPMQCLMTIDTSRPCLVQFCSLLSFPVSGWRKIVHLPEMLYRSNVLLSADLSSNLFNVELKVYRKLEAEMKLVFRTIQFTNFPIFLLLDLVLAVCCNFLHIFWIWSGKFYVWTVNKRRNIAPFIDNPYITFPFEVICKYWLHVRQNYCVIFVKVINPTAPPHPTLPPTRGQR